MSTESGPRWSPETRVVSAGRPASAGAPLNVPIVMASNFRDSGDYTRNEGNDLWRALEEVIGGLEGGSCVAYSSGMAAASAILFATHPATVVVPRVSYMGGRKRLERRADHGHVIIESVDFTDTATVAATIESATKRDAADRVLVWIETPANPTLEETDLSAVIAACRRTGAVSVVDATFPTPLGLRPLAEGADLSMHSGTKFIGGHSDLLIGLVSTGKPALLDALVEARSLQGATPGGLESFLALRGVRTLAVRMEASIRNTRVLHERLAAHPAVEWVRSSGAMLSFVVKGGAAAADLVCESVRLVTPATSLGGVESLIERRQKYAGESHVPPGLLRLSVGIENVDDLWTDLHAALGADR
ncbi:MAG: trans-sulfuration enzyme family protein [Ilumatobacteraceae bacterium]